MFMVASQRGGGGEGGCWNVRLVRDAEHRRNALHLYYMLRYV